MRATPSAMDEYLSSRCLSRAADCQSIRKRHNGKLIRAFTAKKMGCCGDSSCLSETKIPKKIKVSDDCFCFFFTVSAAFKMKNYSSEVLTH